MRRSSYIAWLVALPLTGGCPNNDPNDTNETGDTDTDPQFEATVTANAPSDEDAFTGDFRIENGELLGECTDTTSCSAITTSTGAHTVSFEGDTVLCVPKSFDVAESDNGATIDHAFDFVSECGLAPEDAYWAYDKQCSDGSKQRLNSVEYDVHTEVYDDGEDAAVVMYGLVGNLTVNGEDFANAAGTSHGTISSDLIQIYYENSTESIYFCKQ